MPRAIPAIAVAALLVAVAAPARAGGGGCHEPSTSGRTTTVVMARNCFGPTVSHVAPGDTVRFRNADDWNHTVTDAGLAWGSIHDIRPGGVVSHTFDTPGVYAYACILHPGMVGAVVVDGAAPPGPALLATPAQTTAIRSEALGASWTLALGLAGLAAIVGIAAGCVIPRRRQAGGDDGSPTD